jgi:uncharacterized LabA/DUF88 family protein
MATSNKFHFVKRVMVFIDGGYLRKELIDIFSSDLLDYTAFIQHLKTKFESDPFYFDLLRIYFYDAEPDNSNNINNTNNIDQLYINAIKKIPIFEDRLGTLKISPTRRRRQKGVDTLIAIDLLSKSYQNQFDIAILITGDEDFVPAIDYVKNTGKLVYGLFFERNSSSTLRERFDRFFCLNKEWFVDTGLKNITVITNLKKLSRSRSYNIEFDIETTLNNKFLNVISLDDKYNIKTIKTKKLKFSGQVSTNNAFILSSHNKSTQTFSIRKSKNILLLITNNDIKALINSSFQIDFEEHLYHQWIN